MIICDVCKRHTTGKETPQRFNVQITMQGQTQMILKGEVCTSCFHALGAQLKYHGQYAMKKAQEQVGSNKAEATV